MNERMSISVGSVLLVIGSAIVLLYAIPSFAPIPAALAILGALGMVAGTLLVGTSGGVV
jgi:xanthosine utilization system XapX-like protein